MATTSVAGITISVAVLLAVAVLLSGAAAQAPAPAPGVLETMGPAAPGPMAMDCLNALVNMSDCLTYVEAGNTLKVPDKPCCPELAGLVDSQPLCLCQLLGNKVNIGIDIDIHKALKLPTVCAVKTPPVSFCSALGYPVGVPMPSEAPSPSPGGGGGMSPGGSVASEKKNGAPSISRQSSFLVAFAVAFLTTLF